MKHKIISLAAALFLLLPLFSGRAFALDFVSYEAAMKQAAEEKKITMVFFWADWCRYCTMLRQEVFDNEKVKKAFEKSFLAVSVDVENDKDKLIEKYKASSALPSITFLNGQGEAVGYFDGATDPETFIKILDYVRKM